MRRRRYKYMPTIEEYLRKKYLMYPQPRGFVRKEITIPAATEGIERLNNVIRELSDIFKIV